MRSVGWLAFAVGAIAIPWGCGDDGAADTSGAAAAGTGSTSSTSGAGPGAGGATSTSSGQINTCDETCIVQCDASEFTPSAGNCLDIENGNASNACNPLTNAGCDLIQGEVCDIAPGGFRCYPGPNSGALCDSCGPGQPGCGPGFTCAVDGVCGKFCCNDDDCDNGGSCVALAGMRLGVCQTSGTGTVGPGAGPSSGPGPGSSGPGPGSSGPGPGSGAGDPGSSSSGPGSSSSGPASSSSGPSSSSSSDVSSAAVTTAASSGSGGAGGI